MENKDNTAKWLLISTLVMLLTFFFVGALRGIVQGSSTNEASEVSVLRIEDGYSAAHDIKKMLNDQAFLSKFVESSRYDNVTLERLLLQYYRGHLQSEYDYILKRVDEGELGYTQSGDIYAVEKLSKDNMGYSYLKLNSLVKIQLIGGEYRCSILQP